MSRREIHREGDIDEVSSSWSPGHTNGAGPSPAPAQAPVVYSVADLYKKEFPKAEDLVENLVTARGATLMVGAGKCGKTILATQLAIAVAAGSPLLDFYTTLKQGAALIVEQDDPSGAGSIKDILEKSKAAPGLPLYVGEKLPFGMGPALLEWIDQQARALSLRLIVLDSYTALREARGKGIDIVKVEQTELTLLDETAKRLNCAIVLLHHGSKSSAGLDWSDQAAGTFAMSAAVEGQIHVSRFSELEGKAPERLIRVRGRHTSDVEMVLRFRKETLDYEHVIEGGAAPYFPLLQQITRDFGKNPFGPKELSHATGLSRSTANRQIQRLYLANALKKVGYGEYALQI